MENLYLFLISFTLIFIIYLIVYLIKMKKNKLSKMKEFDLLKSKFKLKHIDYKKIGLILILINSFIISATGTICSMVDLNIAWQLCIGFFMLMMLIYSLYYILGSILVKQENKKGEDKNEHKRNRK